ncbi:single-stranded DNA-binding protein [Melghirimyces algeriensis]|uniref:Uncharacterized protein n=1 Tax=Melghirimyces algeriensis TaxID=910412 RepID=A0A521F9R4_9BACL|nr:single-stranded DNA-binding protein [Melghirimyces algeriensis]SMO92230.1 hypothetical protein SAMN06264849_11444 [Melghirimyces algeriensis]
MGIRDALKKREEAREQLAKGNFENDLPEGVLRYIKNQELNGEGRMFLILDDPDDWYTYFVHDERQYKPYEVFVKKHTCLHSPQGLGEDFTKYDNKKEAAKHCPSCKAGVRRRLYAMIRLFDVEYGTWRVYDAKEFHAQNLINAYDQIEETAKEFQPDYSLVGQAVIMKKTSDGKSFTFAKAPKSKVPEESFEKAKEFIDDKPSYADLANFRGYAEVVEIVAEAHPDSCPNKSAVIGANGGAENQAGTGDDTSQKITDRDLPF